MIQRSLRFDLGRDESRIKDPKDGHRQHATVDSLLRRFFSPVTSERFALQVLADEVGMGKTFVALGVAYSLLENLRSRAPHPDLAGCYQRVLVLAPSNDVLLKKWRQEVSEFSRRCMRKGEADPHFLGIAVERFDDLAAELRKPGCQPQVIVARMSIAASKFRDYALKRRLLLGTLFRRWGARFRLDQRKRLLLGAPAEWGLSPAGLTDLSEEESERLAFNEDELLTILDQLDADGQELLHGLLVRCRAIAMKGFRNRSAAFRDIEMDLNVIYRLAVGQSIRRDFPLVIVDEAHHWKNGPRDGSNGYREFQRHLAPHARRLLLLTATPFQLRPSEMLEMLQAGDGIQPAQAGERLQRFRVERLQPALAAAEERSHAFSHEWSRLPSRTDVDELDQLWNSEPIAAVRGGRARLEPALAGIDPDLRRFLREALRLHEANALLSRTLGQIVIRHRRGTDHRLFRVGGEFVGELATLQARPDRHLLHAAPGLEVHGEGELPQYLLMRCVSAMKAGHGRSSLGSDLTGCYSTLLHSAEGRTAQRLLRASPEGSRYLDLLLGMVREKDDPRHPKLSRVVARVEELWEAGEKVLIFCFRLNTAHRLHDIISHRLGRRLAQRRERCLGGEAQLKALRSRLTGRDRDLVTLGLDRVLWSALAVAGAHAPF